MSEKRITSGLAALTVLSATLFALHAQGEEASSHSRPPLVVATGNFIKTDTLPWVLACEWVDTDGKFQSYWAQELDRPPVSAVPADVLCTQVKRFAFPGHTFNVTTYDEINRPTPLHANALSNFMYVLKGHSRVTVDGKTFESSPRDAFDQTANTPHQNVALSKDYEQFSVVAIKSPPTGEGFKVTKADLARGDLIRHKDAPKSEFCEYGLTDGIYQIATHGKDATVPKDAACFVVYSILSRPGASLIEVEAKKGTKTLLHKDSLGSIIYYVKGKVRATVGDETQEMQAGDATLHPGGSLYADEYLEDTIQLEIRYPEPGKTP